MSQPLAKTPPAYNSSVLCPCDSIPLLVVLFSIAGTGHKIVQPGYCTQCRAWLGTPPSPCASNDIDDEFFNWQMWAVNVVAELLQASNLQGPLAWERFGLGLIPCIEAAGGTRRLARLAGIGHDRLCQWIHNKRVPSFKSVLECCYTLGISPLQAMASDPAALKEILGEKTTGRTLHFDKRMCRSVIYQDKSTVSQKMCQAAKRFQRMGFL